MCNSSSNIFFLFAVNDLLCNSEEITSDKLHAFQDVFLSYKNETNTNHYQNKDKFLVNFSESEVDQLNMIIDNYYAKKISKNDLIEALKKTDKSLLSEALFDLNSFKRNQKNKIKVTNRHNIFSKLKSSDKNLSQTMQMRCDIVEQNVTTLKILEDAGFVLLQKKERLDHTLFKYY